MKAFLALLLWCALVCPGRAQEVLSGVSPDGKYGVLSDVSTGAAARLVALPSRQTLVDPLVDSQGDAPSVLWSADSQRLFCWIQAARVTFSAAYRLTNDSFTELTLPNYEVPALRKFHARFHRHDEETIMGVRWLANGGLVINQAGILRGSKTGADRNDDDFDSVEYSYLVTFLFDRHGTGRVSKIVKDKGE